ncbi:MAG: tetratricopeptide repeat protein, partial [Rhodothermales bacterium]|nr:tetratricopeptide repeat protein [Rhodothermales bacterium]
MRAFLTLLLLLLVAPVTAQTVDDLFREARTLERVQGDFRGAIDVYGRIVDEAGADRAAVARALVRMGRAYESLGRAEALGVYERVVAEYADQQDEVAEARERMAGLVEDRLDAPAERVLTYSPGQISSLGNHQRKGLSYYGVDMSADGRLLAFSGLPAEEPSAGGMPGPPTIEVIETGERTQLKLPDGECTLPNTVRFSPDGRYLAYACWWKPIVGLYDLETETNTLLLGAQAYFGLGEGDHAEVELFDWTQDGSQILVALESFQPGERDPDQVNHLILLPKNGSEPTFVAHYGEKPYYFWENNACLMDGDKFIFGDWVYDQGTDSFEVVRRTDVESNSSETVLYEPGVSYAVFGCDKASNVLYYSAKFGDQTQNLFAAQVEADGSLTGHKLLRDVPLNAWAHPITQNGNLYYNVATTSRWTRNWKGRLLDGGRALQYRESEQQGSILDWTSDGRMRAGRKNGVLVSDVLTGEEWSVKPPGRFSSFAWMDRGERMMVSAATGTRDSLASMTWILDSRRGEVLDSLIDVRAIAVMPDGRSLLYPRPTKTNRRCWDAIDLDHRSVTEVRCFDDSANYGSGFGEVSRSGKLIHLSYRGADSLVVNRVFSLDGDLDLLLTKTPRDEKLAVEIAVDDTGAYLVSPDSVVFV